MSSEQNYDNLIYPILWSEKNVSGFLDSIFDFLFRRTDFFKIKTEESSDVGLPLGEAEKTVKFLFCKYMQLAMNEQRSQEGCTSNSEPIIPDYVREEEVLSTESETSAVDSVGTELAKLNGVEDSSRNIRRPEDDSDSRVPVMDPDSYNGAAYDDYSWSQSLKDVDIRIKVPSDVGTGKSVSVRIQPEHLTVKHRQTHDGEWKVLKESALPWKINVDESMWTLIPGDHVHVCLQKIQERWWDCALVGEPRIDIRAIDPSIPFEDLDSESRAKIDELMYNEQMKRLGKPNVQQTKLHNLLKEAWDKEGSPFKGQPFDPTAMDIQDSQNFKL